MTASSSLKATSSGGRSGSISRLIARWTDGAGSIQISDSQLDSLSELIAGAVADEDVAALETAADVLLFDATTQARVDAESLVALRAFRSIARAGHRVAVARTVTPPEPGSLPSKMLALIAVNPGIGNLALCELLGVRESQVSRAGKRLRNDGLARAARAGRANVWHATPVGDRLAVPVEEETPVGDQVLEMLLERVTGMLRDHGSMLASTVALLDDMTGILEQPVAPARSTKKAPPSGTLDWRPDDFLGGAVSLRVGGPGVGPNPAVSVRAPSHLVVAIPAGS